MGCTRISVTPSRSNRTDSGEWIPFYLMKLLVTSCKSFSVCEKKVLPRDLALRPCCQTYSLCNVPGTSGKSLLHMVTATTVAVRTRSLELTTLVENSNAHSH